MRIIEILKIRDRWGGKMGFLGRDLGSEGWSFLSKVRGNGIEVRENHLSDEFF